MFIGGLNTIKMAVFGKLSYKSKFNTISIKIQLSFFRHGQVDPKIHMELQAILNSQNNLEKEGKN